MALEYASEELKNNPELIEIAFNINPDVFKLFTPQQSDYSTRAISLNFELSTYVRTLQETDIKALQKHSKTFHIRILRLIQDKYSGPYSENCKNLIRNCERLCEANPTISDYPELLTQQDSFSQFKSKATPNSASMKKSPQKQHASVYKHF